MVDAGTATTIDFIDVNLHHRGGYIVPGLNMQVESLFSGTDRVKVDFSEEQQSIAPGENTIDAVLRGILASTIGLVAEGRDHIDKNGEVELALFLTGGYAKYLQRHFWPIVLMRPNLVLDGVGLAV